MDNFLLFWENMRKSGSLFCDECKLELKKLESAYKLDTIKAYIRQSKTYHKTYFC